jgi:hypothetical protein
MRRWEKRLSDLAQLLRQCAANYFDPDLFRMNCNQFLTTSRTVNFLIQKDKASIPDFERWYGTHVVDGWADDAVMIWGKNSRNHIEKEGDLDVESELSVTLIFSYDEDRDVSIKCGRRELVGASVRHLLRHAEKHLPTGVADAAVLRVRRRWVANSFPGRELLQSLAYIYMRQRVLAESLAAHLDHELPESIPEVTDLEEFREQQQRHTRYIKFNDRRPTRMVSETIRQVPDYRPPAWLQELAAERDPTKGLPGLKTQIEFHAKMAEGTFRQFGNHVAMMWLYDEAGMAIDYGGLLPDDQATKFIYWRTVADRVGYLRPTSLIWISEVWIRDRIDQVAVPIRKLAVKGEGLHVVGMDKTGAVELVHWDILRDSSAGPPRLVRREATEQPQRRTPNFLLPVERAFARLMRDSGTKWNARPASP